MGDDEPNSAGGIWRVQIFSVAHFLGWRQSGDPALPCVSACCLPSRVQPGAGDAAQSLGKLLSACCNWKDVKEVMPHKAPVNKTELIIPEKTCAL